MMPNVPPERETLERDGFLLLRQFLSATDVEELDRQLNRFIQHVLPELPREDVFFEDTNDPASLKQIQRMGSHDEWFAELFQHGRFRQLAEQMLDGPVVPKNLQYFNKPAGVGKPTPPHQDGYYFMLDPCEAVTMWLALDEVDHENGCVRYVPGSHRLGMRDHARTQTLGFSQGIADYPSPVDEDNEVAIPARPGDLLVHHAMTIHRADGNQSESRSRRALGLIYYSERAREDSQAHAEYQRRLSGEMRDQGKI